MSDWSLETILENNLIIRNRFGCIRVHVGQKISNKGAIGEISGKNFSEISEVIAKKIEAGRVDGNKDYLDLDILRATTDSKLKISAMLEEHEETRTLNENFKLSSR